MELISNPYRLYYDFNVLKLHFTNEKFDYFTYSGKSKSINEENFNKKENIKKLFYRLAEILPENISKAFFVSQFMYDDISTINKIVESPLKAQKNFNIYKEHNRNILGNLQSDLKIIGKVSNHSWINAIKSTENDYPLLFKLVLSKQITVETYVLLNDLFNHTERKLKGLEYDTLYNTMNLKYRKYRPFLRPTKNDILKIVKKDI